MGATRRHCGHCRSSNTTRATCDPLGGRRAGLRASCAGDAHKEATKINPPKMTERELSLFLMILLVVTHSNVNRCGITVSGYQRRPGRRGALKANLRARNPRGNAL